MRRSQSDDRGALQPVSGRRELKFSTAFWFLETLLLRVPDLHAVPARSSPSTVFQEPHILVEHLTRSRAKSTDDAAPRAQRFFNDLKTA